MPYQLKKIPYLLAKLKNIPVAFGREFSEKDKVFPVGNNMYLEPLWQNAAKENEVFFYLEKRILTPIKQ